ncbi:unnamed protein product [Alternaria alternata]
MTTNDYDQLELGPTLVTPPVKPKFEDVTETEDIYGHIASTRRTAERMKYKVERDRYSDMAILIRRRLDSERQPLWMQIEIHSPEIQEAVAKVCGYSDLLNTKVSPIVIRKPYLALFHYRAELRQYAVHSGRTDQEKVYLKVLVDFMAKAFARDETEYKRLVSKGQISFPLIWTLFKPGEEVFIHDSHFVRCGRVHSLQFIARKGLWKLGTQSWDYNGISFGLVDDHVELQPFEGICDITSLPAYPVRFHKNHDKANLRQQLIERGRKWKSMVDVSHLSYEGIAWTTPDTGDMDELVPIHVSSRIITDYATHQQANPYYTTTFSRTLSKQAEEQTPDDIFDDGENAKDAKSQDQASEKEDEGDEIEDNRFFMQRNDTSYIMSDDQAVLSPAKVRGFSLTDKKWAFFHVGNATDIQWLENPMERLEIDESSKKVINALVTAHGRRRSSMDAQFQDIIPAKGLGLVFLFAGDPGLGKTLTAEVVSEHRKKALYAITSGELGIETAAADQRMRTIFDRAKAWDAYLLLDEADVFLAERDRDNLSRNGLVTVFLRLIEYYEGVIFLTTNRLTAFDPAFESRIQCKLFYDPLTPIQRTRIWRTLLPRRLSRDNEPLEWDENVLRTLGASHNINGREIKNMIVAALALAEAEGESLGEKHLNHVRAINETWAAKAKGET